MWCSIPAYSRSLLARCDIHFFISSRRRSSLSCSCSSALCPFGHHSSGPKPMALVGWGCRVAVGQPELCCAVLKHVVLSYGQGPFASHAPLTAAPLASPGAALPGADCALHNLPCKTHSKHLGRLLAPNVERGLPQGQCQGEGSKEAWGQKPASLCHVTKSSGTVPPPCPHHAPTMPPTRLQQL